MLKEEPRPLGKVFERKEEGEAGLKRGNQVLSCLSAVAFTEWWKAGRYTVRSSRSSRQMSNGRAPGQGLHP